MVSLLSNLVDNYPDNHKTKSKYEHDTKNVNMVELNTNKYCECYFEYTNVKDDLIVYKCFCCNINFQKILMKIRKSSLLRDTKFC